MIDVGQELCSHARMARWESRQINDTHCDILTDEDAGLRLMVSRLGAEMISLTCRDRHGVWQGFLYRDGELTPPASGWANHATVMGYFLHRLWEEKSNYRGTTVRGGNHGFLRHFAFDVPRVGENSLTYTVTPDRIPPEAYPLKVSLELTYRLESSGVVVEFAFTNHEPELDAHVSFGLHPGVAVTSVEAARLLLPAGTYLRQMAPGNFLSGAVEKTEHAGGEPFFAKKDLPGSFIFSLAEVPSRIFTLEDLPSGRRVRLDFSEVPYVTIWSDMHPFLCVEPCWGLPDSNPPTSFENKPGIQVIPAGTRFVRRCAFEPGFLS